MNLAGIIDHTILAAEADYALVMQATNEAKRYQFASVCVNGLFVKDVAKTLRGSGIHTCATIGFPFGANNAAVKAYEAVTAVRDGADEIDFVAHLPYLLHGDTQSAKTEFLEIVNAVRSVNPDTTIKVIIESALLLSDQRLGETRIHTACIAALESGCDFIKSSTGYHPSGGATVGAIALMKIHAGRLMIKASGGIRTQQDAIEMINAGAHRLGCSASVSIITDNTQNEHI